MVFISTESNNVLSNSIIRAGDVLTVPSGYPGTTCVVPDHLDGANCIDLIISRPVPCMTPDFLSLWINLPFRKDQVLRVQGCLPQQHFKVGEMKSLLVTRPDKAVQSKTVYRVANVDGRVKRENRNGDKLGLLKSGMMSDLLSGRIHVHT